MNPKIEKVRDDIRKAEARQREITEYLKTLRIREKQLCDEELIKVMRSMAGKNGDVMELLDKFQDRKEEQEIAADAGPASFTSARNMDTVNLKESEDTEDEE